RLLDRAGGVDQRQVAQALREVAEQLAALGVDLLRPEADVVRLRHEIVHQLGRLVTPPVARERVGEPERAGHEAALLRLLAAVAVDERPPSELAPQRVHRRLQPAFHAGKADPCREDDAGVELARAREERVAPPFLRPALGLDELADRGSLVAPAVAMIPRQLPAI